MGWEGCWAWVGDLGIHTHTLQCNCKGRDSPHKMNPKAEFALGSKLSEFSLEPFTLRSFSLERVGYGSQTQV